MQDPKDQPAQKPNNTDQHPADQTDSNIGTNDPDFAGQDTGNKPDADQKSQTHDTATDQSSAKEIEQKEKQIDPGNEHHSQ